MYLTKPKLTLFEVIFDKKNSYKLWFFLIPFFITAFICCLGAIDGEWLFHNLGLKERLLVKDAENGEKREEEIKEGMVKDAEGVNIWLKKNIGKSLRMIEKSQNWSIMSCHMIIS